MSLVPPYFSDEVWRLSVEMIPGRPSVHLILERPDATLFGINGWRTRRLLKAGVPVCEVMQHGSASVTPAVHGVRYSRLRRSQVL